MSDLRIEPGGMADGAGTAADVEAVGAEVRKLPSAITGRMADQGVRITVCHDNVTRVVGGLINDVPRNWCTHPEPKCVRGQACRKPGVCWTWENVPGMYRPGEKQVVIATRGGRVPLTGDGHGSANLVIHEALHAADFVLGRPSDDDRFKRAWDADESAIRRDANRDYYLHETSGREESYSESGARWYAPHPTLRTAWPQMAVYWSMVDGRIADGDPPFPAGAAQVEFGAKPEARGVMGYGVVGSDGTATLFLRAEGYDGEQGHGAVTIPLEALPVRLRTRAMVEMTGYAATGRRFTFAVPTNFDWSAGEKD